MTWMLVAAALAGPVSEEIVVWGDPYARWEQRWWVESELWLPQPMAFEADENVALYTSTVVARAVLDCGKGPVLGPHRIEAECRVERIGLQVGTRRPRRTDQRALEELVAKLTGAVVQAQVSDDGRVTNVDLEGLSPSNERERRSAESLRQLAARLILPFHLRLPEGVGDGVTWEEANSQLLTMPAEQGSYGASRIVHTLDAFEGAWLVQSIGEAVVHVKVGPDMRINVDDIQGVQFVESAPDSFDTRMHGVALIDPDTGILTERVWSVRGAITGSSLHGFSDLGYGHSGRLRLLEPDADVDVGRSWLASPPGARVPGLPAWVHLDTP